MHIYVLGESNVYVQYLWLKVTCRIFNITKIKSLDRLQLEYRVKKWLKIIAMLKLNLFSSGEM
jgi:hypothetical protein